MLSAVLGNGGLIELSNHCKPLLSACSTKGSLRLYVADLKPHQSRGILPALCWSSGTPVLDTLRAMDRSLSLLKTPLHLFSDCLPAATSSGCSLADSTVFVVEACISCSSERDSAARACSAQLLVFTKPDPHCRAGRSLRVFVLPQRCGLKLSAAAGFGFRVCASRSLHLLHAFLQI